jgi:hypothetical protein
MLQGYHPPHTLKGDSISTAAARFTYPVPHGWTTFDAFKTDIVREKAEAEEAKTEEQVPRRQNGLGTERDTTFIGSGGQIPSKLVPVSLA